MGGMRSKLSSVYFLLQQSIYDIIVLSETWLSGDVLDTEVCPAEYNIYRADRNSSTSLKSRGGGVAIMVRSGLGSSIIPLQNNSVEQLFVLVGTGVEFIVKLTIFLMVWR